MRKYLSVLGLWTRCVWRGAAAILAVMAGVELLFMRSKLFRVSSGSVTRYADFARESHLGEVYLAALALLTLWLILASNGKTYTLGRLSVKVSASASLYAAEALMWYGILWGVQLGVALLGFRLFLGQADPGAVSGQSLMLSFYSVGELNWFLPLSDVWMWVSAVFTALTLAVSVGADAKRIWRGRHFPLGTLAALGMAAFSMASAGENEGFTFFVCILLAGQAVLRILGDWREVDLE